MLEHARPGQGAFLGDVADEEDRRAALLGKAHQQRRALAHLGHAARRRLQLLGEDGLDRVDDHDLGLLGAGGGDDRLDAGLGHHLEPVLRQVQTTRTHGHLLLGFFTGDVECRILLGDGAEGLQQDRRLADTRITADQHYRAVHQPPSEYAIQLAGSGGKARYFLDADLGERPDVGLLPGPACAAGWRCRTLDDRFHQRIPGATVTALAGPFREGRAAFGAAIHALGLGHGKLRV